jgi:DNA-binding response OmpR family regulator
MKEMKERILLIEDEEKLARFVELELSYEGYSVVKAGDGREGLALLETEAFDLLLLDVMLPGLNGMEVLRRMRRGGISIPVLMLTARDSVVDKVAGLDSGANDYITKPFAIEELLARIRSALRTSQGTSGFGEELSVGRLRLDDASRTALFDDIPLDLTKKEFDLLQYLLANKGVVLTHDTLLQHIWGYEYEGESNVVGVYIRFLRSKIDSAFHVKYIHTIRGVGYMIRDEDVP